MPGNYQLERAKEYQLICDQELNRFSKVNSSRPLVYVRHEHHPKSRTEWETFYTYWGGALISGSEGAAFMDAELLRVKIRPEDIRMVLQDGRLFCDGVVGDSLINNPDERTKIVTSWLEEVDRIERGRLEQEGRRGEESVTRDLPLLVC